ncbi:uncharacterized protein RAG0_10100 [Rhynchosporium agropyri]|uniref:Hydrophobin n=1 Tax=Rhynchosporium agropyri TaxID=914238 RepID=A0A1E1KYF2_9HELO|nr:uncharacterized protein RAG0_10100 [Rhynchosporium agropyri]
MRFFLLLIAASSAIARNTQKRTRIPSSLSKWSREANGKPPIPAVVPDYKAELFMCGLGQAMDGYCCQNLSKDGVGLECIIATPLVINLLEGTTTFTCPLIINDVKQNHTTGACCYPKPTVVTPTMGLHKCQGSTLVSVNIESKKPNVIGSFSEELSG